MKTKKVKKCPKCGKTKSTNEYYKSKTNKDGFYYSCKSCIKKSRKNNHCIDCDKLIDDRATRCKSCARKGKNHPMYGRIGENNPMYGKHHSKETKKKISKAQKGKNNPSYIDGRSMKQYYCIDCGKEINWQATRCNSCSNSGKDNPNYKDGRTPLNISIRNSLKYKQWRNQLFSRDNYTCQECGDDNGGNLVVHHIKLFNEILSEFLEYYNNLDPKKDKHKLLELSKAWDEFWDISNGLTLCEACHKEVE